ncbi:MAG: HAMP domain-containing histidine kinase [Acidimicrobiales bacterium]|nr:HAMP domain-containing histidine kinase [Acidimicrobiales bacterium]
MTLRTRLVLALVLLSAVCLATFAWATTTLYERSQRDQLDDQLVASAGPLVGRLEIDWLSGTDPSRCRSTSATVVSGSWEQSDGDRDGSSRGFAPGQSFDGYAELIAADGTLLACSTPIYDEARPRLPDDLAGAEGERLFTTASIDVGGNWRVLVTDADSGPRGGPSDQVGAVVVLAVPTRGVDQSISQLVRIELAAAVALLGALAAGAWVILRRGLHPLEEMATTAAGITAGDLSQRVEPANDHTEVGQLGLALNTMLDGLEGAFQEREATEQRLRRFLADASHELRTPLTSIQGFAELFRLGATNEQVDLPVILRRIEQESGRMKVLVEDLLLLARLDETRTIDSVPVDVSVLAADACTDAVAVSPGRQVTLDAPTPAVVMGDAPHLRQAIANLVTNAVKHTPDGSPIEVSTRVLGDRVRVGVRDHGPGLDPATLDHVFDRFWQADAARVGTGAGLGLAIVAGIAEAHHGTASAANAVDGGAIFTLDLPAAPTS